jgi:hypothetical protein
MPRHPIMGKQKALKIQPRGEKKTYRGKKWS